MPAVVAMARRATLYASSNDRAWSPRQPCMVTRGPGSPARTCSSSRRGHVDVSPIDTSLIGHSYYGNNPLMIRDMQVLVELGTPPLDADGWSACCSHRVLLHWYSDAMSRRNCDPRGQTLNMPVSGP